MAASIRQGIRALVKSVTPSSPPAGSRLLYPKSDGWYELDDAGVETKVGPGGSSSLPARLAAEHSGDIPGNDWNQALETGWYAGSGSANAPDAGWWMGEVVAHNSNWVTQTIHAFTSDSAATDSATYRRSSHDSGGRVWGSWFRVRQFEGELDARYVKSLGQESGRLADHVYYSPITGDATAATLCGWFQWQDAATYLPTGGSCALQVISYDANYMVQLAYAWHSGGQRQWQRSKDAGVWGSWKEIGAVTAPDVQTFNASGTWTKPSGATRVKVQMWGGGGSGDGHATQTSRIGGGGGGYYEEEIPASLLSSTQAVVVGAGGTAALAGGDSTFAGRTALGGQGGASFPNSISGMGGFNSRTWGASAPAPHEWAGGNGYMAISIAGSLTSIIAQDAAYGGAGGGGDASNTTPVARSGFGGNGGMYSTSGGSAGTAPGGGGGMGNASGEDAAGGAGRVIVTSYYN